MKTFTEIRELYKELDNIGIDDVRDAVENMLKDTEDFEVENYRFINRDDIDKIMEDDLASDTYMLGCFNAWFIADITGLDMAIVEKAQKDESFELLGELMLKDISDVQEGYVSEDGYGHYFNHYDGNEIELGNYYIFQTS